MYGSQNEISQHSNPVVQEDWKTMLYDRVPSSSTSRPVDSKKKSRYFFWMSIMLAVSFSTILFLLFNAAHMKSNEKKYSTVSDSQIIATGEDASDAISLIASNEYGTFSAPYPWMSEVLGTQLVEPYKESILTLSGSAADSKLYSFEWIISDFDGEYDRNAAKSQTIIFAEPNIHNITINAYLISGDSSTAIYTYQTRLISKFVKRELRSLTEADREKFLNAAIVMWQYNTSAGLAKYGENYTSIEKFVAVHSLASNDIMCDSFHEGSGFLTHHLALTNTFEASLRSIDPSVTLPYWDFTIEGEEILLKGERPSYMMEVTPIFSDTWFGSVDSFNHIADSRWAHTLMPRQLNTTSGVRNSYGFIRSYWNNNPDPEVSRKLFSTCGVEPLRKIIPTCSSHLEVLKSPSLGEFQLNSAGDGHGPMHVQIGGVWGTCEADYTAFTAKWKDILDANITESFAANFSDKLWIYGLEAPRRELFETQIMGESFHIYRSFWRSHMCAVDGTPGLLKCPDSCEANMSIQDCACKVDAIRTGETDWENLFPCLLNREDNRAVFRYMFPDEMLEDMVELMTKTTIIEGEMIESASTADITFWLIHPAIERLLSAKRLTGHTTMGNGTFSKWGAANETWLEYSFYSFNTGGNPYFKDAYICPGHAAHDPVLPESLTFTGAMIEASDVNRDGVISNWEFYRGLDPNDVTGNDYVFDNFDWEHCQGV